MFSRTLPTYEITSPAGLNDWHHFCSTVDGGVTRLYVDGEIVTEYDFSSEVSLQEGTGQAMIVGGAVFSWIDEEVHQLTHELFYNL